MEYSKESLERKARELGFQSRYLEKVDRLLSCLSLINEHEDLRGKLVLKGGTAINIFHLQLPRLSVDIDLNFIGEEDVDKMKEARPEIVRALETVFARADLKITNDPNYDEHAGITWELSYDSMVEGRDNVKVDLNFLERVPLFPIKENGLNKLGDLSEIRFAVHDLHELAGGKLRALFQRSSSRDLYDVHRLLNRTDLNEKWLRLAFVVYGGVARRDWREIRLDEINYSLDEINNNLLPLIRAKEKSRIEDTEDWANLMVKECREKLDRFLTFRNNELKFLTGAIKEGRLQPELLTNDKNLQANIIKNPGLQWKVRNVRDYFDLR